MRVAVIGNITKGEVDISRYMPEETSSILYIRGQYIGECANAYADRHNLAKLGYPMYSAMLGTPDETEAFHALVDGSEYLLVLYSTPSWTLDAAKVYARKSGRRVGSHQIVAS